MNYKEIKQELIKRDGLRCSLTGEVVESPNELSIEHLTPKSKGGSDELDNLILVRSDLGKLISDDTNFRTNILIQNIKDREEELVRREQEAFDREIKYREELEKKSSELDKYRHRINKEQAEQEKLLLEEVESRKVILRAEQVALKKEMKRMQDELSKEKDYFNSYIKEETEKIKEKENILNAKMVELEQKEKKYAEENKRNLEKKSNDYVSEALKHLKLKEEKFHLISKIWSCLGGISIALGILTLMWYGNEGLEILKKDTNFGWSYLLLVTFKGLILVGLFIALSKYAFVYSQNYMHESIKNSERRHAINFGKFYMESYGASADWNQVKDAFEHWNIECNSAFLKHDSSKFDPKTVEGAVAILNSLKNMPEHRKDEKEK